MNRLRNAGKEKYPKLERERETKNPSWAAPMEVLLTQRREWRKTDSISHKKFEKLSQLKPAPLQCLFWSFEEKKRMTIVVIVERRKESEAETNAAGVQMSILRCVSTFWRLADTGYWRKKSKHIICKKYHEFFSATYSVRSQHMVPARGAFTKIVIESLNTSVAACCSGRKLNWKSFSGRIAQLFSNSSDLSKDLLMSSSSVATHTYYYSWQRQSCRWIMERDF